MFNVTSIYFHLGPLLIASQEFQTMNLNPPMVSPAVVRPRETPYQIYAQSQTALLNSELPGASTSNHLHQNPDQKVLISEDEVEVHFRSMWCNYALPLHIDLRRVAMDNTNVEINRVSGMLEKRKRSPHCFVKISSTGKVNIIGCRREADCKKASRQIARMVQRSMGKLNESIRIRNFKICNVMATCSVPFGIKIEEIAKNYSNAHYEPEINTGLVWKMTDPKATLTIHTTGSINITGACSEADVQRAVESVYPVVKKFSCELRHRDAIQLANRQQQLRRKRMMNPPQPSSAAFYNISKRSRPAVGLSTESYKRVASGDKPSSSGIYGDKMYFSDEDDLYDDGYDGKKTFMMSTYNYRSLIESLFVLSFETCLSREKSLIAMLGRSYGNANHEPEHYLPD
uniref:TATA box-binding protein-like 1 n=1 Tax=Ditylenchus dipsaci TaxID=166011 RepID=A0A915E4G7_9BILA